jgi:hypothetical protein
MLSQQTSEAELAGRLVARDAWRPFPTARSRDPWESLPETIRARHVADGEAYLDHDWPTVLATRFLDYVRDGDRDRMQRVSFGRRSALVSLVLAECTEGEGRFLDDIVNGVWAICEETYWGVSAHIGVQRAGAGLPDASEPTVDLFAAETSALLAWVVYLLGDDLDAVSPLVCARVRAEIDRRILTSLLERDDYGWMGFGGQRVNNWNPWICSNWLASALLSEEDEGRRAALVHKAMRALDNFIDPYPKDGGCDEGPSYWGAAGAAMYVCLELLHSATDGRVDVFGDKHIADIGRFIYRVQINGRYFVNFADAPAMVAPSPSTVYSYGRSIDDERMMRVGAWAARDQGVAERGHSGALGKQLQGLFATAGLAETDPTPPLPRDVWLNEIEVMIARDTEGSSDGFFLAAKGGHNAESHNHNDVGNFVVYLDGKPVIVDAGVEAYTSKTFSPRRYEIWTMRTQYHNLPTVDGVEQAAGEEFASADAQYTCDDASASVGLDIGGAYPENAGIESWYRTVRLDRSVGVTVEDAYELRGDPTSMTWCLLTASAATLRQPGVIELSEVPLPGGRASGAGHLRYDANTLDAAIEEIPIEDGRLGSIWGARLARIVLTARAPVSHGDCAIAITR